MARGRSPRLAIAGGALAVVGGFGHAVFGGIGLAYLAMSERQPPTGRHFADVVTRVESGLAVIFMAAGLLGTVIGLVLLGIALFRSRVVPRWIPVALWLFIVTEFVLTNVSEWASPAAGTALRRGVHRDRRTAGPRRGLVPASWTTSSLQRHRVGS